jgi:hypothetical protein
MRVACRPRCRPERAGTPNLHTPFRFAWIGVAGRLRNAGATLSRTGTGRTTVRDVLLTRAVRHTFRTWDDRTRPSEGRVPALQRTGRHANSSSPQRRR